MVGAVCKKVLRIFCSLDTDVKIPEADWPFIVSTIQSEINISPTRRFKGRCRNKVYTRTVSGNFLSVAFTLARESGVPDIDEASVTSHHHILELPDFLDRTHRNVSVTRASVQSSTI